MTQYFEKMWLFNRLQICDGKNKSSYTQRQSQDKIIVGAKPKVANKSWDM